MNLKVEVFINVIKEVIWNVIIDIDGVFDWISGIEIVEVYYYLGEDLVGFKWIEIWILFGKLVIEIMWVMEVEKNKYYKIWVESYGVIYILIMWIDEKNG